MCLNLVAKNAKWFISFSFNYRPPFTPNVVSFSSLQGIQGVGADRKSYTAIIALGRNSLGL